MNACRRIRPTRALIVLILFLARMPVSGVLCEAQEELVSVQEPRGATMQLVPLCLSLFSYPLTMSYPAQWYVREDVSGVLSIFMTREAVRAERDRYRVGVGAFCYSEYFLKAYPPVRGDAVDIVNAWQAHKRIFLDNIRMEDHRIIAQGDVSVSGLPAIRIAHESDDVRQITLYIKAGEDLVVVSCEAPSEEFSGFSEIFEAMIASVSINVRPAVQLRRIDR